MKGLAVIRDGQFTGSFYYEDQSRYRDHHTSMGEQCVWTTIPIEEGRVPTQDELDQAASAARPSIQTLWADLTQMERFVIRLAFRSINHARDIASLAPLTWAQFVTLAIDQEWSGEVVQNGAWPE